MTQTWLTHIRKLNTFCECWITLLQLIFWCSLLSLLGWFGNLTQSFAAMTQGIFVPLYKAFIRLHLEHAKWASPPSSSGIARCQKAFTTCDDVCQRAAPRPLWSNSWPAAVFSLSTQEKSWWPHPYVYNSTRLSQLSSGLYFCCPRPLWALWSCFHDSLTAM